MNICKYFILPNFRYWLPWQPEFLRSPMVTTIKNAHFKCPTSIQTFWYIATNVVPPEDITPKISLFFHFADL